MSTPRSISEAREEFDSIKSLGRESACSLAPQLDWDGSMYNVFIVGSSGSCFVAKMFQSQGWKVVPWPEEADLIQFCGGSDVDPARYGEPRHPTTVFDAERDAREEEIYWQAKDSRQPMAGICRGAQFLNVMAGGGLWQNVDNHGFPHLAYDIVNGQTYTVTSTHHQMIRPTRDAQILAIATETFKRSKMRFQPGGSPLEICFDSDHSISPDIEVCLYPKLQLLCFQPHPEYPSGGVGLRKWYFSLLNEHLMKD